jgi:hypothetical protein
VLIWEGSLIDPIGGILGAVVEGVNAVLLLTSEDDFNALASVVLEGSVDGPVYRLGPRLPGHGVVAPYTGGQILFGAKMTGYEVGRRYASGARVVGRPADGQLPAGTDLLFLVKADGKLIPVASSSTPAPRSGDTMIVLETKVMELSRGLPGRAAALTRLVPLDSDGGVGLVNLGEALRFRLCARRAVPAAGGLVSGSSGVGDLPRIRSS